MEDTPFWLVWHENGDEPRRKHPTQQSAEAEAERLARSRPGQSFCVLAPLARFTERRVTVDRFNLLQDMEVPF
jgi:hypothetical protein